MVGLGFNTGGMVGRHFLDTHRLVFFLSYHVHIRIVSLRPRLGSFLSHSVRLVTSYSLARGLGPILALDGGYTTPHA